MGTQSNRRDPGNNATLTTAWGTRFLREKNGPLPLLAVGFATVYLGTVYKSWLKSPGVVPGALAESLHTETS